MLIGEVAERSGVSARMLRHYDRLGLLRPSGRTGNGYRHYSDDDLRRLFCVEALRSLGLRLGDVATVLDEPGFEPGPLLERLRAETSARLERDTELLRRLTRVRAGGTGTWDDVLRTTALVRGLDSPDGSRRHRAALAARAGADVGTLVESVLAETDPVVAGSLRWALRPHGDAAVSALARALDGSDARDGQGPGRARRAVEALAALGTPGAVEVLRRTGGHDDPGVRGRALLARARAGHDDVLPGLVDLVAAGRDDVEAADALGRLVREGAVPADAAVTALRAALDGADAPVRRRVTASLAELPLPATGPVLRELEHDTDRGVALTARALLARDS
ncbi:MerR family transcriptional regulator [Aquipuribacter sp. SD81]|uniref:MerR family transcriptional regulator n=1 Tax=Aquipuribacter sp. SD81 TaxID=3127703 RepID=UPI00301AE1A0